MRKTSTEKRLHKRSTLTCPISISDDKGVVIAAGKTRDISDGGASVVLPADKAPSAGSVVSADISVPRSTANTYMLEKVTRRAKVLHHRPPGGSGKNNVLISLKFLESPTLGLEI